MRNVIHNFILYGPWSNKKLVLFHKSLLLIPMIFHVTLQPVTVYYTMIHDTQYSIIFGSVPKQSINQVIVPIAALSKLFYMYLLYISTSSNVPLKHLFFNCYLQKNTFLYYITK